MFFDFKFTGIGFDFNHSLSKVNLKILELVLCGSLFIVFLLVKAKVGMRAVTLVSAYQVGIIIELSFHICF